MKVHETKVAVIYWLAAERALHVRWSSFHDSAELRRTIDDGYALVKKYAARTWIADTSAVKGAMRLEDQQWIGQSAVRFLPLLDAILTIPPTSALAALSNQGWQATIPEAGLVVTDVPDLTAALDIASKMVARKAA